MTLTKSLSWTLRLAATLPFFYWLVGLFLEWHGVEPLVKINTQSGYVVLILLSINLLIGAVHALKWLDIKYYRFLYLERRWLGITCGFYAILHFVTYLAKESFLPKGWEQILTKNYLTAGSVAAFILLILMITSNDFSMRLLKKNWKKLHRLVYLAGFVMLFHIFQIEKANLVLLLLLITPVALIELIRIVKNLVALRNKN
ncbi:ferric reductase-like transmembrane domain-containing protein [bacterium]|nr:ferric reductase-like transmembrane domain-containing protein [bacterium]